MEDRREDKKRIQIRRATSDDFLHEELADTGLGEKRNATRTPPASKHATKKQKQGTDCISSKISVDRKSSEEKNEKGVLEDIHEKSVRLLEDIEAKRGKATGKPEAKWLQSRRFKHPSGEGRKSSQLTMKYKKIGSFSSRLYEENAKKQPSQASTPNSKDVPIGNLTQTKGPQLTGKVKRDLFESVQSVLRLKTEDQMGILGEKHETVYRSLRSVVCCASAYMLLHDGQLFSSDYRMPEGDELEKMVAGMYQLLNGDYSWRVLKDFLILVPNVGECAQRLKKAMKTNAFVEVTLDRLGFTEWPGGTTSVSDNSPGCSRSNPISLDLDDAEPLGEAPPAKENPYSFVAKTVAAKRLPLIPPEEASPTCRPKEEIISVHRAAPLKSPPVTDNEAPNIESLQAKCRVEKTADSVSATKGTVNPGEATKKPAGPLAVEVALNATVLAAKVNRPSDTNAPHSDCIKDEPNVCLETVSPTGSGVAGEREIISPTPTVIQAAAVIVSPPENSKGSEGSVKSPSATPTPVKHVAKHNVVDLEFASLKESGARREGGSGLRASTTQRPPCSLDSVSKPTTQVRIKSPTSPSACATPYMDAVFQPITEESIKTHVLTVSGEAPRRGTSSESVVSHDVPHLGTSYEAATTGVIKMPVPTIPRPAPHRDAGKERIKSPGLAVPLAAPRLGTASQATKEGMTKSPALSLLRAAPQLGTVSQGRLEFSSNSLRMIRLGEHERVDMDDDSTTTSMIQMDVLDTQHDTSQSTSGGLLKGTDTALSETRSPDSLALERHEKESPADHLPNATDPLTLPADYQSPPCSPGVSFGAASSAITTSPSTLKDAGRTSSENEKDRFLKEPPREFGKELTQASCLATATDSSALSFANEKRGTDSDADDDFSAICAINGGETADVASSRFGHHQEQATHLSLDVPKKNEAQPNFAGESGALFTETLHAHVAVDNSSKDSHSAVQLLENVPSRNAVMQRRKKCSKEQDMVVEEQMEAPEIKIPLPHVQMLLLRWAVMLIVFLAVTAAAYAAMLP